MKKLLKPPVRNGLGRAQPKIAISHVNDTGFYDLDQERSRCQLSIAKSQFTCRGTFQTGTACPMLDIRIASPSTASRFQPLSTGGRIQAKPLRKQQIIRTRKPRRRPRSSPLSSPLSSPGRDGLGRAENGGRPPPPLRARRPASGTRKDPASPRPSH